MATERITRYVRLVVDASGAKSGGREVQRALNDINKSTKRTAAAMNGLRRSLLAGFAGFGVMQGIRAIVGGAAQAEQQFAQLAGQIVTTGGAANRSLDDLRALTEEIGINTLASTQEVRTAAGVLLTFKNVSGDVFDSTLRLTQDLAQAGFGNLRTNAVQLGKALNDPIRGLDGLSRAGIQFTDQQKEQIRTLAESGDLIAAQTLVIKELEGQVGGAGVAAAQGLSGAFDNLIERAKLFAEAFGGQGLSPLTGLVNLAASGVSVLTENVAAFSGAVAGAATVAIPRLVMSLRTLALSNPFSLMLAAGAALGGVLGKLTGLNVTFGTSSASVGSILTTVWGDATTKAGEYFSGFAENVGGFLSNLGLIGTEGGSVFQSLIDAGKTYLNAQIAIFKSVGDFAVGAFRSISDAGAALFRGLIQGAGSFGRALKLGLKGDFEGALGQLKSIGDGFDFSDALNNVRETASTIGDNFGTDFVGAAAAKIQPYLTDVTARAAAANSASAAPGFDLSGLGGTDSGTTGGASGSSPTSALENDNSTESWAERTTAALDSVGGSFDKLANLAESSMGRQATAFKALFAVTKATALATAIVNTSQAITEALKLPPPLNTVQAGIASAAGAAEIATITAQAVGGFEQGGYTGDIGTGQVAGVVHGREFVMNAEATRRNRPMLERMNAGGSATSSSSSRNAGSIKVVVVDDRQTAEQFLSSSEGERVVLAHVTRNS